MRALVVFYLNVWVSHCRDPDFLVSGPFFSLPASESLNICKRGEAMGLQKRIIENSEDHYSLQSSGLTVLERESFFTKGYFVREQTFSSQEIQSLKDCFASLLEQAKRFSKTEVYRNSQFVVSGDRIDRIVWACGSEDRLSRWAQDWRITVPSAQILGSLELQQIICQCHYKLPGDELTFPWHQDSQHRGYGTDKWLDVNQKGSFVQTLLAVDDTPLESGPLCFIENTVEKGHLSLDKPENIKKYVDPELAKPVILKSGDQVFFHPFAIHGSKANMSDKPRRVFINGFSYPGANNFSYPGCGLGRSYRLPKGALSLPSIED